MHYDREWRIVLAFQREKSIDCVLWLNLFVPAAGNGSTRDLTSGDMNWIIWLVSFFLKI